MSDKAPLTQREPVLLWVLGFAFVGHVGATLVAIAEGVDPLVAIGTALAAYSTTAGGAKVAQTQAWSPVSADRIMDAHAVIETAERDGVG